MRAGKVESNDIVSGKPHLQALLERRGKSILLGTKGMKKLKKRR